MLLSNVMNREARPAARTLGPPAALARALPVLRSLFRFSKEQQHVDVCTTNSISDVHPPGCAGGRGRRTSARSSAGVTAARAASRAAAACPRSTTSRSRSRAASASRSSGQNGSGKSTLVRLLSTLLIDDGGEARIFGHDAFRETKIIRKLVNRVSVEASFFKKMSASENLSYAARFYGMPPSRDAHRDPGDPREGRLPRRPPRRVDGEPVPRDAAEGRARARAPDVAGAAAARRADDRARPALEARGAGVHPRGPRDARRDDPPLHARHGRGGGARGPRRPARPRRAPVPRAGRGREAALRRGRRSRRRSSPRRAAPSKKRTTRTTSTGRCSHDRYRSNRCAGSSSGSAASSSATSI